jgi:hypothetical protein
MPDKPAPPRPPCSEAARQEWFAAATRSLMALFAAKTIGQRIEIRFVERTHPS